MFILKNTITIFKMYLFLFEDLNGQLPWFDNNIIIYINGCSNLWWGESCLLSSSVKKATVMSINRRIEPKMSRKTMHLTLNWQQFQIKNHKFVSNWLQSKILWAIYKWAPNTVNLLNHSKVGFRSNYERSFKKMVFIRCHSVTCA